MLLDELMSELESVLAGIGKTQAHQQQPMPPVRRSNRAWPSSATGWLRSCHCCNNGIRKAIAQYAEIRALPAGSAAAAARCKAGRCTARLDFASAGTFIKDLANQAGLRQHAPS